MALKMMRDTNQPEPLPRELQMDLLVDAELPEDQRAALLRAMDERPEEWRALALRFLQQQVERQTVRKLMAGGSIVPVEFVPRKSVVGWVGSRRMIALAAGLLIAVTSALLTLFALQPGGGGNADNTAVVEPVGASEFVANIPAGAMGSDKSIQMTLPLVKVGEGQGIPLQAGNGAGMATTSRTWVIQSDGNGRAILIPVNTLKAKVY